jgi:hypothetical protein
MLFRVSLIDRKGLVAHMSRTMVMLSRTEDLVEVLLYQDSIDNMCVFAEYLAGSISKMCSCSQCGCEYLIGKDG